MSTNLAGAKQNYNNARGDYHTAIKKSLKASLVEVLHEDGVENVVFGVSTSPYNDENMGEGVFGPIVNVPDLEELDSDYGNDTSRRLYYGRDKDKQASVLAQVINVVDYADFAAALGVGESETYTFVATLSPEHTLRFSKVYVETC